MSPSLSLHDVIGKWLDAYRAWKDSYDADGNDHDEEWIACDSAEAAMIYHPCHTLEDVRAKARIALQNENVFDSIGNWRWNGERMLYGFLRSLLGEDGHPVDKEGEAECSRSER